MRTRTYGWLLGLVLSSLPLSRAYAAPAPITRVDVFVADLAPIAAGAESQSMSAVHTLELWNLDDLDRLNAKLGAGTHASAEAAAKAVAARVSAMTPEDQALLSRAANGQARADGLGVERVPAVVINESKIYYGAKSIEDALRAYRSGR